MKISASILTADWSRLGEQIQAAQAAGVDGIHLDVMDGHFVPNISFGPLVVTAVRRMTALPLEVHLMITNPELYVGDFAAAGAGAITVQQESCLHLHRQIQQIRELGCSAGVAINPATSLQTLEYVIPDLDRILVMTVNPGFGGQAFIGQMLGKVERARAMLDEAASSAELQVDGGIKAGNIAKVAGAGANSVVAGSAVFNPDVSVAAAVEGLRSALG